MAPALLQCSALPPTLEAFCTRVEVPTRVRVHDFGTAWLVCVLHCDSTSIGVALVQAAGVFSARLTGNRSRRKPVISCAGDSGVPGSGHKRGSTRCVPKDWSVLSLPVCCALCDWLGFRVLRFIAIHCEGEGCSNNKCCCGAHCPCAWIHY